jgi:hypothetical protein
MKPKTNVNNKTMAKDPWNCHIRKLTRAMLEFWTAKITTTMAMINAVIMKSNGIVMKVNNLFPL